MKEVLKNIGDMYTIVDYTYNLNNIKLRNIKVAICFSHMGQKILGEIDLVWGERSPMKYLNRFVHELKGVTNAPDFIDCFDEKE